jgi:N-acetylglucosamine-6-phosphate deacetylase
MLPAVPHPFPRSYTLGPVRVATGDGSLVGARLQIADGRIIAIHEPDGPGDFLLPPGTTLAPGLIDLHTNGAEEKLFNRDQSTAVSVASRVYAANGATGFVATIMTAPWESMLHAAAEVAESANELEESGELVGARCLGIHFEGPFLNARARGIHRPDWLLDVTTERLHAIIEATKGALVMVTMAPEVEGASDAARFFNELGVVCSAGHTSARYNDGLLAIGCGYRTITHAFNAMPPLDHRDPSLLLAFIQEPRTTIQVICDGYHVAPPLIDMLYRLLGERLILSTDNMPPAGSGYHLRGGVMRAEDGTIAGSALTPAQAVRNLMNYAGISFERAIMNATLAPARLLGLDRELGHISIGLRADFSLWDSENQVIATMVGGVPVYGSSMFTPQTAKIGNA